MNVSEFRRLATGMDRQVQQLAAEGISGAHAVINRMMGYVPNLHRIWINASDQQLTTLPREFPGFYRYAHIVEEASGVEHNKASWPYDGTAEFPEQRKGMGAQLLTTVNTLKRGCQALHTGSNLQVLQSHLKGLGQLHRQWLSDLDSFKNSLHVQGAESKVLEYMNDAFGLMAKHIKQLAG